MKNGMYCRACLAPLSKIGNSVTCTAPGCDFNGVMIHRDEVRIEYEPPPIRYEPDEPDAIGDQEFLDLIRECHHPDENKRLKF